MVFMSLDFISRLNQLVPNPACVYNILEPILHSCEVPEQVEERTKLSVGLSLCEFIAASVDFPPVCLDPNQVVLCTKQLETKATWWTTFSGNYRHISVICHEYQPQFEAKRFMQTFKDAGKIFDMYQHEMNDYAHELSAQRSKVSGEWKEAASSLSEQIHLAQEQLLVFQSQLNSQASQYSTEISAVSYLANDTLQQMMSATVQMELAAHRTEKLMDCLGLFDEKMDEVHRIHLKTAAGLHTAAREAQDTLKHTGKALQSYNAIFTALAKCVGIVAQFLGPVTLLVVLFCIYWFRRAPKAAKLEEDMTFY